MFVYVKQYSCTVEPDSTSCLPQVLHVILPHVYPRSKELESGGGAAALQGVGIQAVVTEFLIVYADLIFSDKMPNYHSPELKSKH